MKPLSRVIALLLFVAGCVGSNPTGPTAPLPSAPPSLSLTSPTTCDEAKLAWSMHPNDLFYIDLVAALCRGTGTPQPPLTCTQMFTLAYGPYNGSNVYWDGQYRLLCGTPPRAPTPPPPPTYPAPAPKPTCQRTTTGCTKTAGNN